MTKKNKRGTKLGESDDSKQAERVACNCQAIRHPLLTIAPNCLNCGKIICEFEGIGPCTYCGVPVLSREQQLELTRQSKKQKQVRNQQPKKNKTNTGGTVRYAAMVSGNMMQKNEQWVDLVTDKEEEKRLQQIQEERRLAAERHKDKLLEFDRQGSRRTKIIDERSDFVLPGDGINQWLTLKERDELVKKQEANLKKLETPAYRQRTVMTIDPITRRVTVERIDTSIEPEQPDSKATTEPSVKNNDQATTTPVRPKELGDIESPRFILQGEKAKESSAGKSKNSNNKPRISRVQDDLNSIFDMAMGDE
ncbi:11354_t:CDS:2 [Paraglomus occultum]|uniref:11354_t:CDS:1 n=1 Tax=Paraglomus occultum TaxID=144539 RepID=A0A9N9B8Z9_9GLOM|nr:11354_t:CDS:2 [Paraglomus occultum]